MIYVQKANVKEKDFITLLEKSRELTLDFLENRKNISPIYFETTVFERMRKAAKSTDFEGMVKQTGKHVFPDIIANGYFGAEVKMTTSDRWVSTGNSVLESTRPGGVERIYIFFGKFGGDIDIRYRLYQECLYDIGVTHSPRYKIDMNLSKGKSIFDKLGVEYEVLRQEENPIGRIKDYYRTQLKEGEELWWMGPRPEELPASPIIRSYRNLSGKEKKSLTLEVMALFPEIFGDSMYKYERVAIYWLSHHNVVSSSLRDRFSAGGQVTREIKGQEVRYPKILEKVFLNAKGIKKTLEDLNLETVRHYWRNSEVGEGKIELWKKLLKENVNWSERGVTAVDIFEEGLK